MFSSVVQIDNMKFNEFLKANKTKINTIIPKNPSITKDDEWYNENCWDEDNKECSKE